MAKTFSIKDANAKGWGILPTLGTTGHRYKASACRLPSLDNDSITATAPTIDEADEKLMQSITAIENHPEAERLLEECKKVLQRQRDFNSEVEPFSKVFDDSMDILAKLEARGL